MTDLSLTLRQRQILNYLQHASGYTTGTDLSRQLKVSTRTVRNDISAINHILESTGIQITSKHSYGYIIRAKDAKDLQQLTRVSCSFISRTERIRHIALRLCLADNPINLFDLADEMYISKTTLEHDIQAFRNQFIDTFHIHLDLDRHTIFLEKDERKRRRVLLRLYTQNWDYNGRGNTYYKYQYLDEKVVNLCVYEISHTFDNYQILIEDNNMVHIDLIVAIAYHRIKDGYTLTDSRNISYVSEKAQIAVDSFLNSLEKKLDIIFSANERFEIYELLSCSIFPDLKAIEENGVTSYFSPELIRFTNQFLKNIKKKYRLDFFSNTDFYSSLLCYLHYLELPQHNLNYDSTILRQYHSSVEFEFAFSIQPSAFIYYGHYLDRLEILYLSILFTGVLTHYNKRKLETVILCHLNLPAAWNMRIQVENHFPNYIHVTHLFPMYMKDKFDFSHTDLVLSTTSKIINTNKETSVIKINPYIQAKDLTKISNYINELRFKELYGRPFPHILNLLNKANWHEKMDEDDYFALLHFLGKQMIDKNIVDESYVQNILEREQLFSYAYHPTFLIIHSDVPAKKTHIEIATLNHRIKYNNLKIRMIIMIAMQDRDSGLIFKFLNELYNSRIDTNACRFLKTKREFLVFLKNQLQNN